MGIPSPFQGDLRRILLRVRILLKKPLILTFSQREKELPILILIPINDHLLIYERYLIIKPFFKGK